MENLGKNFHPYICVGHVRWLQISDTLYCWGLHSTKSDLNSQEYSSRNCVFLLFTIIFLFVFEKCKRMIGTFPILVAKRSLLGIAIVQRWLLLTVKIR